jgi:polyisoprenoid-binding protein YceI
MSSTRTLTPVTVIWNIDRSHTHVDFAVRHLMISTVRGRFSDVNGTVRVPDGDFSRAEIEARIGVDSIDTREPKRDAHLKSPDFFDAAQFPTIEFRSRRIEPVSNRPDRYAVVGDLTIHGVVREVTLTATAEGRTRDPWGGERTGFSLEGRINRTDFGLTWNQLLESGGVLVGEEVKISIDAELVANAQEAAA